jgi:hypothetical protein
MVSTVRVSWIRIALQALTAGITGAIVIDLYLWVTTILPQHTTMVAFWQWIASTVLGKVSFTSPSFAVAGLAIHVLVSIGWAGGYAYLAARQPIFTSRWATSGLVYGVIVYVMMQVILLADNNLVPVPNPNAFVNIIIAHTVFFGLPVAYVIGRLQSRVAA